MYWQQVNDSGNGVTSVTEYSHTGSGSVGVDAPTVVDKGNSVCIKPGLTLMRRNPNPNYSKTKEINIMTNLFNAERAITAVHSEVLGFDGIIAGGIVADRYFNVDSKDIDVFVSYTNANEAIEYADTHGFTKVGTDLGDIVLDIDSYGRSRNNTRTNIVAVYKGFILGYPTDIVIAEEDDVRVHIDSFDLNIKRAYYDGRYHYTEAFMNDVTTGIITPNVYESTGYIRAKLAADKYGMEISPMFELSRNYVSYLKEHDHFDKISKKYHEYVASTDIGSYKEHIVQAADLFKRVAYETRTEDKRMKKFATLSRLMKKRVQTLHPITREHLTLTVDSMNHKDFDAAARTLYYNLYNNLEERELMSPLMHIQRNEFNDGTMLDANGRRVRINKFINKLIKKMPDWKMSFDMMSKLVETRGTQSSATVEFSASTKDLLQISTHKGWSSCQKWSFDTVTGHNVGTLGNLGGATVVGILKTEDSKKWGGRFLVRIGEDNALWLEGIYTHRAEFGEDQGAIISQVADQLRELGYTVFTNSIEGMMFNSLAMQFRPYNDTGLNLVQAGSKWYFRSRIPFRNRQRINIIPRRHAIPLAQAVPVANPDGNGLINIDPFDFENDDVIVIDEENPDLPF